MNVYKQQITEKNKKQKRFAKKDEKCMREI